MSINFKDDGFFRRKFPRRMLKRRIGLLSKGRFFICDSEEIGEGGMSLLAEFVFTVDTEVVITLKIPAGDFVSVRGVVKTSRKKVINGVTMMLHGISFANLPFAQKRQIRAYVSARTVSQKELLSS